MKKRVSKHLTPAKRAELEALAALPDEKINTKDIPEVLDWSSAQRGLFFRPVKKQLTLRLDADIIAWFRSAARKGEGYQTRINTALREYVERQAHGARKAKAHPTAARTRALVKSRRA